MTKLNVRVEDLPQQVTDPGEYTIKSVAVKQQTRIGTSHILTVTNGKEERSLFVQHSDHPTSRTNLGRLIIGLSDDTDRWVGKKIRVTFDADHKRKVEPIVKP